jgi:hypothetical protein
MGFKRINLFLFSDIIILTNEKNGKPKVMKISDFYAWDVRDDEGKKFVAIMNREEVLLCNLGEYS